MSLETSEKAFGFFVGVFALFSAVLSTILYYRAYLPGAEIKVLDELLRETMDIYDKARAGGLLPNANFCTDIKNKLSTLEARSDNLREATYRIETPFQEYLALIRGLSWKIRVKSLEVRKLRALLMTTTEEQKKHFRDQARYPPVNSDEAPADVTTATPDDNSITLRPSSCPPSTRSSGSLESPQPMPKPELPLFLSQVPARSDSDAQSTMSTLFGELRQPTTQHTFARLRRWMGFTAANPKPPQQLGVGVLPV